VHITSCFFIVLPVGLEGASPNTPIVNVLVILLYIILPSIVF